MRILTGTVFILNIILWLLSILLGFLFEGIILGVPGTVGFVAFLIAWHLSGGVVTAPADYFFQPEWSVFKVKLKWANSMGISIGVVVFLILGYFS